MFNEIQSSKASESRPHTRVSIESLLKSALKETVFNLFTKAKITSDLILKRLRCSDAEISTQTFLTQLSSFCATDARMRKALARTNQRKRRDRMHVTGGCLCSGGAYEQNFFLSW